MFSLFGFNDYESRKVGCYEKGDVFVSTAAVPDSSWPYETAVAHPNYNRGQIVIVDNYPTFESAEMGHERWVKIMTTEPLPERLKDVGGSWISQLLDIFLDDETWRDKAEV